MSIKRSELETEREKYVYDMILASYPNKSKIKSIVPFYCDWLGMAQSILPGQNLFFGKLSVNQFAMMFKAISNYSAPLANFQNFFTSLFGRYQYAICGPLSASSNPAFEGSEFNDILFDDIVTIMTSEINASSVADINGQPPITPWSISGLVPGSNTSFTSFFSTVLASNPLFVYAPQALYFSGHKVVMEG